MEGLRFTKMHGLGNDFVIIDGIRQSLTFSRSHWEKLADRRLGIGCDQVLVVTPSTSPDADFGYRIFNADGKEVDQCGNGARCLAAFIHAEHLSEKTTLRLQTRRGILQTSYSNEGVTVDMGTVSFSPPDLPCQAQQTNTTYTQHVAGQELTFGIASIGNPHAIISCDQLDDAPVDLFGAALNDHAFFPDGVNVSFMNVLDRQHIELRVYERGVGETRACGSAAVACVAWGVEHGLLRGPVHVELPGGTLQVGQAGEHWLLYGPYTFVYQGTYYE